MSIRFAVLGTQRSGTVLLQDLISSHPDAHCWGEILLGMDGPTAVGYPPILSKRRRIRHGWQYMFSGAALMPLHVIRAAFAANNSAAVGFRVMYNQLSRRRVRLLQDLDIKMIHVRRANVLRQYVSLQQMHTRQVSLGPGSAHSEKAVTFGATRIDAAQALTFAERRVADQHRFSELFAAQTVLDLWYEPDIAGLQTEHYRGLPVVVPGDPTAPLGDRLAKSLGLPSRPLSAGKQKTGSSDLSLAVTNYGELQRAFADTAYAWMLSE